MSLPIDNAYGEYYKKRHLSRQLYPVEFLVRTLLGTYPRLHMDRSRYQGARALDLGFGDGRNFGLMADLGFLISGMEISEEIVKIARDKFGAMGLSPDLRVGRNAHIPFGDRELDFVMACHSIYYVDQGDNFSQTLAEVARVLKPGGTLIASLPKPSTYILQGAQPLGGGHFEIRNDPLGIRNGTIFRVFESHDEIKSVFSPFFCDFALGGCDDDFYGIQQDVWIVTCNRKK